MEQMKIVIVALSFTLATVLAYSPLPFGRLAGHGEPVILDARIVLNRNGTDISLEVGNMGDAPIKLRKGGLSHHIEVSKTSKTITVTLDDGEFVCGGYTLTFSEADMNIVTLKKSQYTEMKLLAEGEGGNFGSSGKEIHEAITNNYSVVLKMLFDNELTGHTYWIGEFETTNADISTTIK